jgi:uncharacterized protein YbcI
MAPRDDSSPVGAVAAEVSNAIVHLLSRHYGRGPTKAKTYLFDNYVFVVLQNILTTSEETLVEAGQKDLVRKTRLAFQEVLAEEFMGAVAKATGKKVVTYHSQVVFDPDMGFEIFVLENDDAETGERA